MSKYLLISVLVVLVVGLAAAVWWLRSMPGAQQLDTLDRAWPGGSATARVVEGEVFDTETGLRLDVWRPDATSGEYPIIIFGYGGGWSSGARDHYGFAGRALASLGYVTVIPDYRLYPQARFPDFVEDFAAAVAWTHDNVGMIGGDADRLFLAGHSAGAYNVMMVALDRQWLGRHGKQADIVKGVAALAGPYDFHPFDVDASRNSFGEYPKPHMTQPVNFARGDGPPLLLLTGSDDVVVGPYNSHNLRKRTLAAGGHVEYREYPGLDHYDIIMSLSRPFRSKAPVLDDMAKFFAAQD